MNKITNITLITLMTFLNMKTTMKNMSITFATLFLLLGCGGGSSTPPAEVQRDEVLIKDFSIDGQNKRVYVEIRDFNSTVSDEKVSEMKQTIASWAESYWRLYEVYDFKSPATGTEDGREILKLFLEQGEGGYSGSASGAEEWLRLAGPPLNSENRLGLEATVAHEMAHSVQFKSNLGRFINTLNEGTATLLAELLNLPLHEKISTTYSCDSIYLGSPNGNMWFRPAGSHAHNVCASSLWWRYVSQQFSSMGTTQYDYGIDTVKEMFAHLETPEGWRLQESDNFLFTKDFNGNDVNDILVQSDTHIAVLSPVLYNATSIDVVSDNGRFDNGWQYHSSDRVVGSCHLGGPNGSAFLLQSETHFGVIGMEDDAFKTLGVIRYGEALGTDGWVIHATDKILATADFDADGRCEFLIQSATHLGLVTHKNGVFETLSVTAINQRLGANAWLLKPTDELIGTGDFNGDNSIDFVLKSDSHLGVITYDRSTEKFITLASMNHISSDTTKYFVGRVKNDEPECLIIGSPSGVQVFALGTNANLEQISNITPTQVGNTFASQLTLAKFIGLSDLDGNGEKELLVRYEDGTLIARKLNENNLFGRLTTASNTQELNDGLNGSQYRTKWTASTTYKVLLTGDLDGDGKDEVFIRDNGGTFVLDLNPLNQFTVHTRVENNSRFDSLIKRTDNFIRSKTLQARNLHTLFNDFAVANYLNALDGVSESKYKYARKDAIDVDHNTGTPPVTFRFRINVESDFTLPIVKQEPWSINYFEFRTASLALGLSAQMEHNIRNANYTFLVVKGNELIRKAQSSGENFLRTIVLEEGEKVVLIVSSFDAPLEYKINTSI